MPQQNDDINSNDSGSESDPQQPLTQDDLMRQQLLDQLVNADSFKLNPEQMMNNMMKLQSLNSTGSFASKKRTIKEFTPQRMGPPPNVDMAQMMQQMSAMQ